MRATWHDEFWTDPPPAGEPGPSTDRVAVRRNQKRARYDRAAAEAILDATPMCHLAFLAGGHPMVIPTLQVRIGDHVYIHTSSGSRMGLAAGTPTPVTLNVTLVDALVLARSGLHHSMNHRSVVIVGEAVLVTDHDEKVRALDATVDKVVPGRAAELRPSTAKELSKTAVLRLPMDELSLKVRADWAVDEPEDLDADVWAGLVPVQTVYGQPEANPDLAPGISPSGVVAAMAGRTVEDVLRHPGLGA